MVVRSHVVALVCIWAIDANDVDCRLVNRLNVSPAAVHPGRTKVDRQRSTPARAVLHLDSMELAIRVRDEIERRMFRRGEQHHEALTDEVGMRFRDSEIALVLRMVDDGHAEEYGRGVTTVAGTYTPLEQPL